MNAIRKQIDFWPVMILVFAPSIRLMIPAANALVLYVLLPLIFLWALNRNKHLLSSKYIKKFIYFLLWLMFATILSTNVSHSISGLKPILAGFLISTVFYALAISKTKNGYYLLIAYVLLFVTTLWYLWRSGELISVDVLGERLNDELVNANDLAYYLFYVACAMILLFQYYKVKKIWSLLSFVMLIVIAIWISLITASRQVLLVVVPYIGYCLYFQFFMGKKSTLQRVIPLLLLVLVVFLFIVPKIQDAISGSYLETRMETSVEDDTRTRVLKEAIHVGIEHPIFGVGPDCMTFFSSDGAFSHNSYSELFATSGVPSLILYLLLIFPILKSNLKRYKETKDSIFSFLFWTSLLWMAYNVLYVFYFSPWLIAFYFLLIGISDRRYSDYLIKVQQ